MDVDKVSTKDDVVTKDELDSQGVNSQSTGAKEMEVENQRKPRVEYTYSKEDLLNLRESPASKLWPSVLSDAHVRHGVWDPEAWHQSLSGKRSGSPADELKRQHLGIEDGIVLSPQRQSFVQGCQIPQSAPERGAQQERTKSGISRTTDRDREGRSRLTGRVGRGRALDYKERGLLQERNKDSERDERGLKGRERLSDKGHREKDKEQKKKRDESSRARNVHVQKRHVTKPEKEPEWYTFGPSSQFETMELKGFDEEEERDRERRRSASEEIKAILSVGQEVLVNGEVENSSPATSSSPSDDGTNNDVAKKRNVDDGFDKAGTRPFDINQFFVSETLLPFSGGMDQGNSRFCQFFGEPDSVYSSSRSESAGLSSGGANTPRTPSPGANYLFTPIGPSGDVDLESDTLAHVLGQTKVNVQPLLDEVMSTGQDASKIKGSIRLEDIEAEVRKENFPQEKELVDAVHNKENNEKGGDEVSSLAGDMLAFNMLVEKMKTSGTLPEKPQPAISGLPTHLLPRPPSPKRKPPRRSPSPLLDLRRSPSPAELLQQLTMQAPLSDLRPPSPAQVVPQLNRSYSPLEMFHKVNAMVTPPEDLFSSPLLRRSPSPLAMLVQQRRSPPLRFGIGSMRRGSPQSIPLYQKGSQPPRKQSEPLSTPMGKSESATSEVFRTKSVSSQSATPHIIDRSFMPTSVIRKIHQDRMGNKTDSGDQTQGIGQVKARPDADGASSTSSSWLSHEYGDTDQYRCTSHSSRGNPTRQPYIGPLGKSPTRPENSAQEPGHVFVKSQLYRQFSAESAVSSHGHHTTMRSDQLSAENQDMNPDLTVLQKPSAFKPLPGSPKCLFSGLRSGAVEIHSEPPSPLHSMTKTTGSPLRPTKMMTHSAPCTPQRHPLADNATLFSPQQLASRGPILREQTSRSLVEGMGQNASSFSEVPLESQMRALQNGLTQVVAAREGRPLSHSHEQHVPVASKQGISSEAPPHSRRNESSSVLHHSPNNIGFQRMNICDASTRHDNPPLKYHSRIHGDNRPIPSHHIPRQFLGSPGPRPGFHIPSGRMSPSSMAAMHGHPGRTPFNSPMPGIGLPSRAAVLPGMMQHHFHPAYLRMLSSSGPPMGIPPPQMRMPGPHSPGRYPAMPGKPPLIYGGRPPAGYPAMSPAAMMAARSLHVPPASTLQQVHRSHAPSPVMNHPPQSHSPGNGNILSQWFSDEVLQQAGPMPRSATLDLARKVMSVEDLERQQTAAIN